MPRDLSRSQLLGRQGEPVSVEHPTQRHQCLQASPVEPDLLGNGAQVVVLGKPTLHHVLIQFHVALHPVGCRAKGRNLVVAERAAGHGLDRTLRNHLFPMQLKHR